MEESGGRGRRSTAVPPLHAAKPAPQAAPNRVFAVVYFFAILALLYHHAKTLISSTSSLSFSITLTLLLADLFLVLMWVNTQALHMFPVHRQEFPENLERVVGRRDFPGLDVFICTADPQKEPPMGVVNTALSVMAYEYPSEKLSVYVSDDGGSVATLFAFVEAAKFARHWLPYCKRNKVVERHPQAHFESNQCSSSSELHNIKMMYESMKVKVEQVVERGKVDDQYINGSSSDQDHDLRQAFNNWRTHNFTRHDHPSVIQVLLESKKDKDIEGEMMPNLVYVSREKRKVSPHHFKGGALNVLLRISAVMTNAPTILIIDCDSFSNDPQTPLRAMCYLCDPNMPPDIGFVQFPQLFRGINKNDIYAGEYVRLFVIQMMGMDGLKGPNFVGSGCFFRRRAFFGGPSNCVSPEIPELQWDHVMDNPIQSPPVLELCHRVSTCTYENHTHWGSKIGFRYGSLVEDYYTAYRMMCEGWRSSFCNPKRPAFYGDVPICLVDVLYQQKRWSIGLLEVGLSRFSPLTFGVKSMGILTGLAFAQPSLWAIWSIPITLYAFLPQLALLNHLYIFPKASEPWFLLYAFLFLGAYIQDLIDFLLIGSTFQRWWNDQRFWYIRGVTCYLFGITEFFLKSLGISMCGFNVTNKVQDDQLRKKYEQGMFEFGVHCPMFVSLTMAALINLIAFLQGVVEVAFRGRGLEGPFVQVFIAGFGVVNCWPVYEAIALRSDEGKMPIKTTFTAIFLSWLLYIAASLILGARV